MKFHNIGRNDEEIRMKALNRAIQDEYGHLANDEVDALAGEYNEVFSEFLEVVKLGKRKCDFMKSFKLHDAPFEVQVPAPIVALLKRYDPFFLVLGRNEELWQIVYMSPHYLSGRDIDEWAREHVYQSP